MVKSESSSVRCRFLIGLGIRAIKNPLAFMRNLRWRYIQGFIYNFRHSDISTVKQLVDFRLYDSNGKIPKSLHPDIINPEQLRLDSIRSLDFVTNELPLVSIIIPIYNQWHYTYYCLKSILENTHNINYEVILIDDCSKDETPLLIDKIKGIQTITNEYNLGFLLSCNKASTHARGKYIVFLNNDTYVLKNWLRLLINVIENDPSTAIVGSKIIDRYGRLQECGWKVGSDGWGLPIGRGENPNSSEYSNLCQVDSISGACFLVRKETFFQMGKFDTRYIPGFFEEIDLSYAVQEAGYKVLIEPKSVIIHFGSITYGDSRRQKYCTKHHGIFMKKWKNRLIDKNS